MDKDDKQHLEEYRRELSALKVRIPIMEKLIKGLESKEKLEVPTQHDFPNYAKYKETDPNKVSSKDGIERV